MSHIFDPSHFMKLDNPKRREAMPPSLVCNLLALTDNMTIADVGCGIGFFTFPFAEIVKQVEAIDISKIMTDELTKRINNETNISVKLGDFNTLLEEASLDLFFTATVIHELANLENFTIGAIKKLKVGGRLAYLDFEKKETDFGPAMNKRIASESVMDLFKKAGLNQIIKHKVKEHFYLVIGEKLF